MHIDEDDVRSATHWHYLKVELTLNIFLGFAFLMLMSYVIVQIASQIICHWPQFVNVRAELAVSGVLLDG